MLTVESTGPVRWVTIQRPEVRNALNRELIDRLREVFLGISDLARVVVLRGANGTFCAGGDLNWMRAAAAQSTEENRADALALAKLFQSIADCPAVVISVIEGHCFGGGCGLVAASDVAIAHLDAQFAFSEVKLGLIPATISPFVVPKIGVSHALALFATGERFGAERALRFGLVHETVSADALQGVLTEKINAALSSAPGAVLAAKRLVKSLPESLEAAADLLAEIRALPEAREGTGAFLEKRKPSYATEWRPEEA